MHVRGGAAAASRAAALLSAATALQERIREAARPRHARCACAAAAARISTATRRAARCSTRAPTPASSTTSRPSWWSPRAAARRSPSSKTRCARTARCCRSSRRISAPARRSAAASPPACPARGAQRAGALRDFVLGAKLIDGRGSAARFGGQVMKNVAGYDVSRLLAGSLGTLGLIAEVSLKVLPRPPRERTLRLRDDRGARARGAEPLGRPAAADLGHRLARRRARACACPAPKPRCAPRRAKIGGERGRRRRPTRSGAACASRRDPFFAGAEPLWRLAVPPATPPLRAAGRAADRVGRRPALAEVRRGRRGDARGGAARAGPCDAVPRRAAQRRGASRRSSPSRCGCTAS